MANKVSEMFEGLTNNFKGMIDANSVVGEPIIVNDGTMIVPISKVSLVSAAAAVNLTERKTILKALTIKTSAAVWAAVRRLTQWRFLLSITVTCV